MRILKYISIFAAAAAAIFWLRLQQPSVFIVSGQTMGTYYGVKIRNGNKAADQEIERTLAEVNAEMSVFDPDSEISRINKAPANQWLELSEPMQKVLQKAREVYRQSNGAFDPTVGRLIELWGFGTSGQKKRPDDKDIQMLLKTSGFDKIHFSPDGRKLKKANNEVMINLSAIAKGYGVDRIAERLEELGMNDYVIEIGGEVRAAGQKSPAADGWNIGIIKPEKHYAENAYIVTLKNGAVATSGSYRNFFEEGGKRFSHTISPQTGYPVESNMVSVTVFHPSCMTADALATALMAMGEEKARQFVQKHRLDAIFFIRGENGNISPILTDGAKIITGVK